MVSLSDALALALRQNATLEAYSWEVRVREAETLQAGLFPNPEIEMEVENFGGTGDVRGFGSSETTLALGQLIELGGKRKKRRDVATLEQELAGWDYQQTRRDLFKEVEKAFFGVLAAQENIALANDFLLISEELRTAVSRRVDAGAASTVELMRAEVAVSIAQIEQARTQTELLSARAGLAAAWGSKVALFERAWGDLFQVEEPPALDVILPRLAHNPDIARWSREIALREAVIALEDAQGIPDITASGGLRRLEDTKDTAFVFGLSVPLALTDRNQGTREAARRDLLKARHEQRAVEVQLRAELEAAYQTLKSRYDEIGVLRDSILPQAKRAHEGVEKGYARGLFRYVDVLEAQRTLFELQTRQLEALHAYHVTAAEIGRLTGEPLSD